MPLDQMMDLCPWKLTVYQRAKANTKARTRVVDPLVVANGPVDGSMVVDEAVEEQTRGKVRGNQKANPKERKAIRREDQKERKEVAEERCHTTNVPIVWNMDIGAVSVHT